MTRDELLAMQDRELDAMVAERVMGWRRDGDDWTIPNKSGGYGKQTGWSIHDFDPSTNIAAWSVVEKGWFPLIRLPAAGMGDAEHWSAAFHDPRTTKVGRFEHRSAPRAICVAALLAVESAHEHPTRA